jgi:SAM-dependent methyltransferase
VDDLPDRIIPHYERHARAWDADRRRSGWNDKPWHDRFVTALQMGARVLDLGCGSGAPVALNMAACGLIVTGIDASPSLISLCRERMPSHRWIVGDMRSPPTRERFDGILAWDSFFHLKPDDQRRMFRVFAEHGGRRAVLMFNAGPGYGEAVGELPGRPALPRQFGSHGIREAARRNRLRHSRPCRRRPRGWRTDGLACAVARLTFRLRHYCQPA